MAAKKILILAGDYSEDYEVMCPYVTLRSVGHDVHVASPNKNAGDTIRTSIHEFEFDDEDNYSEKPGHRFTLNTTFADINVDDYDGLFCPGGRGLSTSGPTTGSRRLCVTSPSRESQWRPSATGCKYSPRLGS